MQKHDSSQRELVSLHGEGKHLPHNLSYKESLTKEQCLINTADNQAYLIREVQRKQAFYLRRIVQCKPVEFNAWAVY